MSLIHRYQSNGYNIVLDINSGCIHLVDLVTYEVLPFMEEGLSEQEIVDKLKDQYPEADIRTSVSECEKLKEQGMLFTRDIYENIIDEFTENRQTVVKALCLHIAQGLSRFEPTTGISRNKVCSNHVCAICRSNHLVLWQVDAVLHTLGTCYIKRCPLAVIL